MTRLARGILLYLPRTHDSWFMASLLLSRMAAFYGGGKNRIPTTYGRYMNFSLDSSSRIFFIRNEMLGLDDRSKVVTSCGIGSAGTTETGPLHDGGGNQATITNNRQRISKASSQTHHEPPTKL